MLANPRGPPGRNARLKSISPCGRPLNFAILPPGAWSITHKLRLDLDTPYYAELKEAWGEQLERVFREALPKFEWETSFSTSQNQTQF